MNIQQIRDNIKSGRYTASDPELNPIAYPNLHRLNPVQASPDERAVARAKLRLMGEELKQQFRDDLEECFGLVEHPKAQQLWVLAWEYGHSNGLYEVLLYYEDLIKLVR